MITIAAYIDTVGSARMEAPTVLSPDALLYAERYFRRHGEELAKASITAALDHFRDVGARAICSPSELVNRDKLLPKMLTDTQPLLDRELPPLPRFFSQ
jgi:hypothetical protein